MANCCLVLFFFPERRLNKRPGLLPPATQRIQLFDVGRQFSIHVDAAALGTDKLRNGRQCAKHSRRACSASMGQVERTHAWRWLLPRSSDPHPASVVGECPVRRVGRFWRTLRARCQRVVGRFEAVFASESRRGRRIVVSR